MSRCCCLGVLLSFSRRYLMGLGKMPFLKSSYTSLRLRPWVSTKQPEMQRKPQTWNAQQMRQSGPTPMDWMKVPTEMPWMKMNTQSSTEGQKMSCRIQVPMRKEQGPQLKLNPTIWMKVRMTVKTCSCGTKISMKATSSSETIITRWPYIMKARRPYFSRNWPEKRVTITCKRFKQTKTDSMLSLSSPATDRKDTFPPKLPSAAPPDSWLKKTIPLAMNSLRLWDSAIGSKKVAFSASISISGNLFASLNSSTLTSSYIIVTYLSKASSCSFSIMFSTVSQLLQGLFTGTRFARCEV